MTGKNKFGERLYHISQKTAGINRKMLECYFCGSTDDIEEHHILPQRFEGSDKESNTVDLCHKCHWKLERLYNKEFWEAIGVEDPRATKESHVTCSVHGCMEPSTGRYHITADTGSTLAYRCDKHVPGEDNDDGPPDIEYQDNNNDNDAGGEEQEEEDEEDWLDKMVSGKSTEGSYTNELEYGFNQLLDGKPVSKEEVHDTFAGLMERLNVLEEDDRGRATGVRLSTGHTLYSARYEPEEGEWVIAFEGGIEDSEEK